MEASQHLSSNVSLPSHCLFVILKYLELRDIFKFILPLSKEARKIVEEQNYIMFKKLLEEFNLHSRLKRADTPARADMISVIKECLKVKKGKSEVNLEPYGFSTDGGTYNNDHYYFIQNVFSRSAICYSTKVPKNANVQFYLGKKVSVEPTAVPPS